MAGLVDNVKVQASSIIGVEPTPTNIRETMASLATSAQLSASSLAAEALKHLPTGVESTPTNLRQSAGFIVSEAQYKGEFRITLFLLPARTLTLVPAVSSCRSLRSRLATTLQSRRLRTFAHRSFPICSLYRSSRSIFRFFSLLECSIGCSLFDLFSTRTSKFGDRQTRRKRRFLCLLARCLRSIRRVVPSRTSFDLHRCCPCPRPPRKRKRANQRVLWRCQSRSHSSCRRRTESHRRSTDRNKSGECRLQRDLRGW